MNYAGIYLTSMSCTWYCQEDARSASENFNGHFKTRRGCSGYELWEGCYTDMRDVILGLVFI